MSSNRSAAEHAEPSTQTTVDVRCTGHVRTEIGEHSFEYTFEGSTLRAFLDAFFEEYDVADMLIAETEADATTEGGLRTTATRRGPGRRTPKANRPARSPAWRSTAGSTNTSTDSTPN